MRPEFKDLLLAQLDDSTRKLAPLRLTPRPRLGWLRAIRLALGLTQRQVAKRLGTTKQHIAYLEAAESASRITLKNLRSAANALECELCYVLLPRRRSFRQLSEILRRDEIGGYIDSVQHTMALENQSIPRRSLERKVRAEIRKRAKKE